MFRQQRTPAWLPVIPALLLVFMAGSPGAAEEYTQKPTIAPTRDRPPAVPAVKVQAKAPDQLGPTPFWVWGADSNRRYVLRKEFAGGSSAALLQASCDNRMVITINGQEVARSDTWQNPVEVEVQKFLKAQNNLLQVEVSNNEGPAGLVLKLALTLPKAEMRYVVSDESWQAAEKKDANQWVPVRKIAKLGELPWGNVFARTTTAPAPAGPGNAFQVLPGFQVEHLFTVPKDKLGSWVSLTTDDKGRLLASDQDGKGLCRITPPKIGSDEPTRVERLDAKISAAQGLLHVNGTLYVSVNGGPGSGLYRVRATKGDDRFDSVVKLRPLAGGGEHGPHALRLAPDGKSIFLVAGNHTRPPDKFDASRLRSNWAEDLLLPRQWDANGHARGILAPGGWIARTDFDGKTWEMYSTGYRNAFDMAFNADGELFAYDSDMEWDMGMPWYRPTRVNHAVSGSEFGWRSGTGVWPNYYIDSLPPMAEIGPGSPVGVEFGYGASFPAKYQKALFCCDWTFGTIYALHLEPDGASYKATKEEFLARNALPLTDLVVAPDGAMYFAIGGRGGQSELFRVTYVGKEPTDRVEYKDPRNAELRALRRQLEQYHAPKAEPAKALDFLYPHLAHTDRFIRYAARVALEHQPPNLWQERVLAETDPARLLEGAVALARQGDKALQPKLLAALDRLDFKALSEFWQLGLLRTYGLVFMRLGEPDKETAERLAKKLDPFFPAKSAALDRELAQLLVYLKWPPVIAKCLTLIQQDSRPAPVDWALDLLKRNPGYAGPIIRMQQNAPDPQKFYYAFALRNLRDVWTPEQRRTYFRWLDGTRQTSGGSSFQGFINNTDKEAFDNCTDIERLAIEAAGLRKPFKVKELPKPQGPGRDWKLEELVQFAQPRLKGRDFKQGQKMYAAARCIICHRFNAEGGATGPDLTQLAGRFSLKDMAEAIVEPGKVIPDLYKASVVATKSGKIITGKIVSETKETLIIVVDPEDSTKVAEVKKADVDEIKPSPVSLMPDGLLKTLNENEVLDLLAYLLSRGEPANALFRK